MTFLVLFGLASLTLQAPTGHVGDTRSVVVLVPHVQAVARDRAAADPPSVAARTRTGAVIGGTVGVLAGFVALYVWNQKDQVGPTGWEAAGAVIGSTLALSLIGALIGNVRE